MKKLLVGIILLTSQTTFAALSLKCDVSTLRTEHDGGFTQFYRNGNRNEALVVPEFVEAKCENLSINRNTGFHESYVVQIKAGGVGLRFTTNDLFIVECPLVRENKVINKGSLILAGAHVSAVVGLGAHAGIYVGQRASACYLLGVQVGIGANASIGGMAITHGSEGIWDMP